MSIDLQRFNTRLSDKLGGIRVRKEAFVDFEVYCHDPNDQPIPKIHFAEPPSATAPTDAAELSRDQFRRTDEDFPVMGDEYAGIYLKAEEEMRRLRESVPLRSEDFNLMRDLLEKMNDPLVSVKRISI